MYGVLLAGGLASRLGPITKVINKHLLPVYDKPMIFYGIETLRDLGCDKIIIILGGNSVGDIVNLVRDGSAFGVEVTYKFQHEPKGISHAIALTEDIILNPEYDTKFLVLLGDNIFANIESLKKPIKKWSNDFSWNFPWAIFLHESGHPHDYGQPLLEKKKIVGFVEKNKDVDHNKIVTGLYGLATDCFAIIQRQEASDRGELEITDTLAQALKWNGITPYDYKGFWSDCGTPEGLVEASIYMRERDKV